MEGVAAFRAVTRPFLPAHCLGEVLSTAFRLRQEWEENLSWVMPEVSPLGSNRAGLGLLWLPSCVLAALTDGTGFVQSKVPQVR